MYFAETELGECLAQHFEAVFEILQVALFAFLDEWEYKIHLAPLVDLLADTVVECGHTGGNTKYTWRPSWICWRIPS